MLHPVVNGECSQIADFGVALQFVGQQAIHTGLVYRDEEARLKIAHLLYHKNFQKTAVPDNGFFCANAECVVNEARRIDLHARLIAMEDRQEIYYAFRFDSHCFDRNLRAKKFPVGYGLTCASFVVSVFHSVGIRIADLSSWTIREEDTKWQRDFLEELRKVADSTYVETVAKLIPTIRIRPPEAAACVMSKDIPVKCSVAEERAALIIEHVAKLMAKKEAAEASITAPPNQAEERSVPSREE
jgi:hypothetical protein